MQWTCSYEDSVQHLTLLTLRYSRTVITKLRWLQVQSKVIKPSEHTTCFSSVSPTKWCSPELICGLLYWVLRRGTNVFEKDTASMIRVKQEASRSRRHAGPLQLAICSPQNFKLSVSEVHSITGQNTAAPFIITKHILNNTQNHNPLIYCTKGSFSVQS